MTFRSPRLCGATTFPACVTVADRAGFRTAADVNACCMLAANPNSSAEINRALMKALVEWVVRDTPPPPSRYPRFDRGDSVPPTHVATGIPGSPVSRCPTACSCRSTITTSVRHSAAPTSQASSRCSRRSSARCCRRSCPEWTPTATSSPAFAPCCSRCRSEPTPGGTRSPAASSRASIQSLGGGGYIPFATTRAERLASGDSRLSLEERYGTHDAYVTRVRAAAGRLVEEAFPAAGRCRAANRAGGKQSGGTVGYQLSADQLSAISSQLSAISNQLTAISSQFPVPVPVSSCQSPQFLIPKSPIPNPHPQSRNPESRIPNPESRV